MDEEYLKLAQKQRREVLGERVRVQMIIKVTVRFV